MPEWEESVSQTRARYEQIIKDLADKHPSENLLLVTHGMYHILFSVLLHLKATFFVNASWILITLHLFAGEGVGVALSSFKKGSEVLEVDYCGYVELRRPIFMKDHSYTAGEFEALTNTGQTGVKYII